MAKVLATPGVYIEERSAFSSSVVPVATAVPAFIGYTQKARRGTKSLTNVPTRISSMAEFEELFGGAPATQFTISGDDSKGFALEIDSSSHFTLHSAMRFYFSNGGGNCYIVSVGDYSNGLNAKDFNDPATGAGIASLPKFLEPTMLVIPEAVLLEQADCYSLQQAMLSHCGYTMQNRFALLDVYNGTTERTYDDEDAVNQFREGIGANFVQWGAAYYPYVHTTIVQADEVGYLNISNRDGLVEVLTKEVSDAQDAGMIKAERADLIKAEIARLSEVSDADGVATLTATLKAVSPMFKAILGEMRDMLNVMPASSAMAGVYAMVDSTINVAKAPANVSLGSVVAPAVSITSEGQEDLNLPLNGKAVNAVRTFQGKGVLVWGARTLDGNSQDWRYVSVRRSMIFLEQSIKMAAEAYVFEPNNTTTWTSIRAMVTNFLNNQWQSGILAGSTPDDAFSVEIGLGVTMTPNDILDGLLKMTVKVAITRPAEFIVITFQQQQQKS